MFDHDDFDRRFFAYAALAVLVTFCLFAGSIWFVLWALKQFGVIG